MQLLLLPSSNAKLNHETGETPDLTSAVAEAARQRRVRTFGAMMSPAAKRPLALFELSVDTVKAARKTKSSRLRCA